jgi:hypothetical protein
MIVLNQLVMKTVPIEVDKKGNNAAGLGVNQTRVVNGAHISYPFNVANNRVTQTNIAPKVYNPAMINYAGMYSITLTPDAAGNTFFLPYGGNEIHSVKLPARPDLLIPAVTNFITANLSGCCIYIEKIAATNEIIFYHANSVKHSPDRMTGATQPSFQSGLALADLDRLYRLGTADYPGLKTVRKILTKVRYNSKLVGMMAAAAALPENKGKTVSYGAGTLVAGFFTGGAWQFWFQTFGRPEQYFDNPMSAKATRAEQDYGPFRVIECDTFYP